ncbi:Alpha-1_3-fucosyltransferase, partial [Caligus rogercresseyi]
MFVLLESPNHDCGFNFGRFNHVFNWTITYRRDSDLVFKYGGFEPVSGIATFMIWKAHQSTQARRWHGTLYGWECKAKLSKQYKFYLAFENSVCKDYATEKFYDVMKYDVVPVVYGLANYSALAPPHSYIDALGEYLTYLDKNDEEYLKYFKWRENYR